MNKYQSVFNAVVVGTVTFLLVDRFSSNREDFPLQNEVEVIRSEFYLHYLANKSYPTKRTFLSQRSANIIAAYPERFRWDEEGIFLHFTPRTTAKFAPATIGEPGKIFEHNCQVFKVHARWNDGFKDDYEASGEELNFE